MKNNCFSPEEIIKELDKFLHRNDYESAEKYLLDWLCKSVEADDVNIEILVRNELMGLYRKKGRKDEAFAMVEGVLEKISQKGLHENVGSATTYLNSATVYKAFSEPQKSIALFERAKAIYEKSLNSNDPRFAGLYNNMALTLVDLKHFDQAFDLYERAISVIEEFPERAPDIAITYLNMANAVEAQKGIEEAHEEITEYLKKAEEILENFPDKDGYYAFVCEKCASVFGYYGNFFYENELKERARRIYEGN